MKIFRIFILLIFSIIVIAGITQAGEITILYTGETHAMLYPCNCPKESDGGVARRATLIKELRKKYPGALLLDSGGFFGGGLMDEHTQNTQLDTQRTRVNLKAIARMGYDALAAGDDEFNFGREFFQTQIRTAGLTVLACNIEGAPDTVSPYIIKDTGGIKVGIIGLAPVFAQSKTEGLRITPAREAAAKAVAFLRSQHGAHIIILVSHQGEQSDRELIEAVPGIDIIIMGHSRTGEEPYTKFGKTLLLRPAWQGRRLGRVTLKVENGVISGYNAEELRLSDKVADDPDIRAFLPACFTDSDCKKNGTPGNCLNPGRADAQCEFPVPTPVNLSVVMPEECVTCAPEPVIDSLRRGFPGLKAQFIDSRQPAARKLIRDFNVKGLPAFFLGREIEKAKIFGNFKKNLDFNGSRYMIKPEAARIAYFLNRVRVRGKLDFFINLYHPEAGVLFGVLKDFNPQVHFLVHEVPGGFKAGKGLPEIEESLRTVCVQKYALPHFWDYLSCRAKAIESTWWEDCASAYGIDPQVIKCCAQTDEGAGLLRRNIAMNRDLNIMSGPAYLMDNQEVFSSEGTPSKEELAKILRR